MLHHDTATSDKDGQLYSDKTKSTLRGTALITIPELTIQNTRPSFPNTLD